MKKVFSIFLAAVMLINMGIMVMAEENHTCVAASSENILGIGDFEDDGEITYNADGTKGTDLGGVVKAGEGSHGYIVGYSDDAYCGEKSLELYHNNANYPAVFIANVEPGSKYKFSAMVKLKDIAEGERRTADTNMQTITANVYTVTAKDDVNNTITELKSRWGKYQDANTYHTKVSLSTTEWKLMEMEFFVPNTADAPTTAKFAVTTGLTRGFLVDDVSLVKVGSVDIDGASKITAPTEGNITSNYTVSGEGVATVSDLALAEEYAGVTLENGVLTVTPEASGEITIGVKKNVAGSTDGLFVATKTVSIDRCIAASSDNILGIGDFENDGEITYNADGSKGTDLGGVVKIGEGNHGYIVGYSDDAYCGEKSLELYHNNANYPAVFIANVEPGSKYKFSAMVKLKDIKEGEKRNADTNMQTITANVYTVTASDSNNTITELKSRWGKYQDTNSYHTKVNLSTTEWKLMEMEFFVPNTADAPTTAKFAVTTGLTRGFLVDDVSLVKVGSVNIDGASYLTAPTEGNITSNYTVSGEGVATTSDLALAEEYAGVTLENGVLTVTPEATGETITIGVKKNLAGNADGLFVATKTVDIHSCTAASSDNLLGIGDFETESSNITEGTGVHEGKIVNIDNKIKPDYAQHSWIVGYSADEAYCGKKSLELYQGITNNAQYYPVSFIADVETGGTYKFSAYVKLKEMEEGVARTVNTNIRVRTNEVFEVTGKTDTQITNLLQRWGDASYTDGVATVPVNTKGWQLVEGEFFVPKTDEVTTKTVEFALTAGLQNFYVDDVTVVKTGSVDIIGESYLTAPDSEAITSTYTLTGEGIATSDELVLAEEYEGITLEDGILTINPETKGGTITIGVKKSVKRGSVTADEFVVVKNVEVHKCIADTAANLLTGGDFETTCAYIYKNPEDPTSKIKGIEGNAVELVFADNSTIVGYSDEAYCGEQSLEINQVQYYPVTFKAHLEKGSVYKFTAFVNLKDNENTTHTKANLLVTTDRSKHTSNNGIFILEDGTLGSAYGAGTPWGTGLFEKADTFPKGKWTKFERTIYVSDDGNPNPVEVWMGLINEGNGFNYYIDDVTLVKVDAEFALDGQNYVDIPSEASTTQNYTLTTNNVIADASTISLANEVTGVTYADGVLTVTNEAQAGVVTLQVTVGEKAVIKKDIVLFDNTGKVVNVTNDGAGNVSYKAYVKETIVPSAVLLMAEYNSSDFENLDIFESVDMGDYFKAEMTTRKLSNGTYKFMLWQGLDSIKPIVEAEDIVVNVTAN